MQAAGIAGNNSAVRGLAVISLTFACILHALWRKGGIICNNILAVLKVSMLLAIIVIGFASSAGASFGNVGLDFNICQLYDVAKPTPSARPCTIRRSGLLIWHIPLMMQTDFIVLIGRCSRLDN